MQIKVDYTNKFKKRLHKIPTEIKISFVTKLELFKNNRFFPVLNNHALTGKYRGLRSINITGDWRALYAEHGLENGKLIIFHLINTHSELYK